MRLTALVRLLLLLLLPALLSLPAPAAAEEVPPPPPPPSDGRDLDGVVRVSPEDAGVSHTPRTASSGEDVHVAWIEAGRASVRTLTGGGRSPEPVRQPTSPDGGRALEVDVAAAGDRAYLVWDVIGTGSAGGYSEVWIAVSDDRGETWESSRLSGAGWQPRVDASGDDVAVTWIGTGSAHGAFSEDGGVTFDRTRLGTTGYTNAHDVAVSRGTATVAFYDTQAAQIVAHRWAEGWQPAVQLSALPAEVKPTTGLKVRSDHSGTVAVMWMARPTANAAPMLRIESSRDDGRTWGREVFTDSSMQVSGFGDLAVHRGTVHAVWRGPRGLFEVFSTDDTGEQYASRDIAATSTLQPRLAVTSAGVAVGWYAGHSPDARIHGYVATRRAGSPTWWTREVPSPSDGDGQGHAYDLVPTAQEDAGWGVAWVRISGPKGVFGDDAVVYRPSSFGPEDLEVLSTRLVQGPLDGTRLVAGRGAVVHVRVRSTLDTSPRIDVRVRLVDAGGHVDESLHKAVQLRSGVNDLFFDRTGTKLSPGTATVEVDVDATDVAAEASETNNSGADSRTVVQTMKLDVHFSVLGGTPLMEGPNPGAAFTMRAEAMRTAADMLPISVGEMRTGFHTPHLASLLPGPHLSSTWVMLRELALTKQVYFRDVDMWVVVVPEGFFKTHSTDHKGARAVAAAGARLGVVMIEEQATSGSALAHEIAHDFGWVSEEYEDEDSGSHMGQVPASGYSVRHGRLVRAIDMMDRYDGDPRNLERWVSGLSWESLIDMMGSGDVSPLMTASAAVEASVADEHLAVTGTVQPDGTITLSPVQTAPGAPVPAPAGDVTVRLLDGTGRELASTTAAAGVVADADPLGGRVFSAQLPAVEGAARVDVTSGSATGSVERSASPQVRVLAPTAPVTVAAGSPVPVRLEVTDPDDDAVTTTLEVDDGTGWGQVGQLAADGTGEVVPGRLLTGQSLQVRAVSTDGWGSTVTALPGIVVGADRALGDLLVDKSDSSGTREPLWPLDVEALSPTGGPVTSLVQPGPGGQPITPASSPDGRQLSFSEGTSGDLVVASADGTGRRTLVDGVGARDTSCGRWSPDGRRIAFHRSSSQLPSGQQGLYVVDVATGAQQQVAAFNAPPSTCHLGWADGAVHFLARTSAEDPRRSAFRVAPDGTDRRLVLSPAPGAELRALTTSRDGRQVAVAEGTAASQQLHTRLLVLPAGSSSFREVRAVTGRVQHQSLAFGPTGEDLAAVAVDLAASNRNRIDVLDLLTGVQRTGVYASPADHKNYSSLSWRALRAPEPGPRVVADAGGPYTVQEGGTLTLSAAGSRADAGGLRLAWDTDGDGVTETEGSTVTVQPRDDGSLRVPLVATDDLGQAERTSAVVTVRNAAPVLTGATAVRDATGVTVDARGTDAGLDDVLTARVLWSDGVSTAAQAVRDDAGWSVTGRRDGAPDGPLVLVLSDGTDEDGATLEVTAAPAGTAPRLADRTVTVGTGQAVALDDLAVDPDGDPVRLVATGGAGSTTVEDGVGAAGGPRLTHVAAASTGTYAVSLVATDARGLTARGVLTVVVVPAVTERDPAPVDLPPTVSAGPDGTGVEGSAVSLTGSASDDGTSLALRWTASRAGCTLSAEAATSTTVTCRDEGPVELVLTADDGVNPPVSDAVTVTVTNAAPTVAISSPAAGSTVPVGTEIRVTADVLDAGADDLLACSVSLGDGTTTTVTPTGGRCELLHRWSTGGTRTVTVTVTDGDGGTATATRTVEVLAADSRGVRLLGAGVTTAPARAALAFAVADRAEGLRAGLVLAGNGGPRFTSVTAEGWVSDGRTSRWRGTGRWGRTDGYRYTVEVVRKDTRTGLQESRVTLVVTAPNGTEVWRTPSSALYVGGTLLLPK